MKIRWCKLFLGGSFLKFRDRAFIDIAVYCGPYTPYLPRVVSSRTFIRRTPQPQHSQLTVSNNQIVRVVKIMAAEQRKLLGKNLMRLHSSCLLSRADTYFRAAHGRAAHERPRLRTDTTALHHRLKGVPLLSRRHLSA